MTAHDKLNTLVSSATERGLTKTYIASLIDVSPRTLGRLQAGLEISEDRLNLIEVAFKTLGITSGRTKASDVHAPLATLSIHEKLSKVLEMANELGVSKQAIADELGTSRRTLDRWADGIHPIPETDIRADIEDIYTEYNERVGVKSEKRPLAATVVVIEREEVAPVVAEPAQVINYVTIDGSGSAPHLSTLAKRISDVSASRMVIHGLDECDIIVNKRRVGRISNEYLASDNQRVQNYFRQSTSFKRGDKKAYIVTTEGNVLVDNVTADDIETALIAIEIGTGIFSVGGRNFDVANVAYIITSPDLEVNQNLLT